MPRKVVTSSKNSSNHQFLETKCLVAITYTSPEVSVTASKRVPGKKKGPRGFKFEICIKSTLHFLDPVTRMRFHLKTQRYRCGFTSCLHGNDENDHENANV